MCPLNLERQSNTVLFIDCSVLHCGNEKRLLILKYAVRQGIQSPALGPNAARNKFHCLPPDHHTILYHLLNILHQTTFYECPNNFVMTIFPRVHGGVTEGAPSMSHLRNG
jgi:hypothetical protein